MLSPTLRVQLGRILHSSFFVCRSNLVEHELAPAFALSGGCSPPDLDKRPATDPARVARSVRHKRRCVAPLLPRQNKGTGGSRNNQPPRRFAAGHACALPADFTHAALGMNRDERYPIVRHLRAEHILGFHILVPCKWLSSRCSHLCSGEPLSSTRNECRVMVGETRFVEVFVDTPLEVCEQRDIEERTPRHAEEISKALPG